MSSLFTSYPRPLSKGEGWRGWSLALNTIAAYSDPLPRPPLFRGAGGMSLPFYFIPPTPFKRGGADAVGLLLWMQLLHPPTRHRDLPSLEGPGVCLSLFFIPLATSYPRPLSFIPPGFAVPLWERGRRADAVGLLLWLRIGCGEGWRGWSIALNTIAVCIDPPPRPPLFRGAGGMYPLFISYPPASPYPFGKGDGRAGAVGLSPLNTIAVCTDPPPRPPLFRGAGGMYPLFISYPRPLFSYPPASPYPFGFHTPRLRRTPLGKGMGGAGAVGL